MGILKVITFLLLFTLVRAGQSNDLNDEDVTNLGVETLPPIVHPSYERDPPREMPQQTYPPYEYLFPDNKRERLEFYKEIVRDGPPIPVTEQEQAESFAIRKTFMDPHNHWTGVLKPVGLGLLIIDPDEQGPLGRYLNDKFSMDGALEEETSSKCVSNNDKLCLVFKQLTAEELQPIAWDRILELRYYIYARLATLLIQDHEKNSDSAFCKSFSRVGDGSRGIFAIQSCLKGFLPILVNDPVNFNQLQETERFNRKNMKNWEILISMVESSLTSSPKNDFDSAYMARDIIVDAIPESRQHLIHRYTIQQLLDDGLNYVEVSIGSGKTPGIELLYDKDGKVDYGFLDSLDSTEQAYLRPILENSFPVVKPNSFETTSMIFNAMYEARTRIRINWIPMTFGLSLAQNVDDKTVLVQKERVVSTNEQEKVVEASFEIVKNKNVLTNSDKNFKQVAALLTLPHVIGVDYAGPEKGIYLQTEMAKSRLKNEYELLLKAATTLGKRVLMHIHAGEGSAMVDYSQEYGAQSQLSFMKSCKGVDLNAVSSQLQEQWCIKIQKPIREIDPIAVYKIDPTKFNEGDLSSHQYVKNIPLHFITARNNIASIIDLFYFMKYESDLVAIRIGHATHVSKETSVKMAKLKISADVNLNSNLATNSLYETASYAGNIASIKLNHHSLYNFRSSFGSIASSTELDPSLWENSSTGSTHDVRASRRLLAMSSFDHSVNEDTSIHPEPPFTPTRPSRHDQHSPETENDHSGVNQDSVSHGKFTYLTQDAELQLDDESISNELPGTLEEIPPSNMNGMDVHKMAFPIFTPKKSPYSIDDPIYTQSPALWDRSSISGLKKALFDQRERMEKLFEGHGVFNMLDSGVGVLLGTDGSGVEHSSIRRDYELLKYLLAPSDMINSFDGTSPAKSIEDISASKKTIESIFRFEKYYRNWIASPVTKVAIS